MHKQTVIVSKPQREKAAEESLEPYMKVTRFCEIRRRRLSRNRYKMQEANLVPRYLFADTTDSSVIGEALAADHAAPRQAISMVLGTVPDGSLDPLRALDRRQVDANAETALVKPQIGSLVTLKSGPLEGWNVTVRALHGKDFSATCKGYPIRLPYSNLHPG